MEHILELVKQNISKTYICVQCINPFTSRKENKEYRLYIECEDGNMTILFNHNYCVINCSKYGTINKIDVDMLEKMVQSVHDGERATYEAYETI